MGRACVVCAARELCAEVGFHASPPRQEAIKKESEQMKNFGASEESSKQ